MVVLWILGESKSGKSKLAEAIFSLLPGEKFYIGTLPRIDRWKLLRNILKDVQKNGSL